MNALPNEPTLKEINAFKKQLTWGEVPAVYHMAATAVGDLDSILTHGFDSAYKRLFNQNNFNLPLLGGAKDPLGKIIISVKPKIALRHVYNKLHYELHCYPVNHGDGNESALTKKSLCPFIKWHPEHMQMLFRVSSLISFIGYSVQSGDEADLALIKFAYYKVEKLLDILKNTFDVVSIKGYSIAQFYQEIELRRGDISAADLIGQPNEDEN